MRAALSVSLRAREMSLFSDELMALSLYTPTLSVLSTSGGITTMADELPPDLS